jgi:hypothetical protein
MAAPHEEKTGPYTEVRRLLLLAVKQRRPVAALYDGLSRLLCPHVLGWNKAGEARVFCYQYGGDSKAGLLPGPGGGSWRCIAVGKLSRVELLQDPWRTEPHAPQRCVERIEADAGQPEQPQ